MGPSINAGCLSTQFQFFFFKSTLFKMLSMKASRSVTNKPVFQLFQNEFSELGSRSGADPSLDVGKSSNPSDQVGNLGGGSQHGRGRVLRAEEVEVDVGEADVVPHQELPSPGDESLFNGLEHRKNCCLVQFCHLGCH